jgi:hypothetical protein
MWDPDSDPSLSGISSFVAVHRLREVRASNPVTADDDRMLHGAGCQGCLLISETSCEAPKKPVITLPENGYFATAIATGPASTG